MEAYLEDLTWEFRAGYKPVAERQHFYEAKIDAAAKKFAESDKDEPSLVIRNEPWELLTGRNFPRLSGLIEGPTEGQEYTQRFKVPLDDASRMLRIEHARILGRPPEHSPG